MTDGHAQRYGVFPFASREPFLWPDQKLYPKALDKLEPSELARLMRENAEALFKGLAGKNFHRAFNPDCPPRRRGRPRGDRSP